MQIGKSLAVLSLAAIMPAWSFGDTILLNDTFDSGSASAWNGVSGSSGFNESVQNDPVFGGNAMYVEANTGTPPDKAFMYPSRSIPGSPVTLNTGDSLTLTADFRFVDGPGNSTQGIRFGIGNSTDKIGYALYYGSDASGADSGTYDGGMIGKRSGSGVFTSGGSDLGTTGTAGTIYDQNVHSLSLKITNNGSGVDLVGMVDGNTFTASDASPEITFDKIQFENGAADYFGLDNVQVTLSTATPEPASLGLLAVGAMGLLARKRKAR